MPGSGNTYPKDMEALLPLMNMVIYSIDKAKKFRLNREVRPATFIISWHLLFFSPWGRWSAVKDSSDCIFAIVLLLVDLKVLNENSFMKEY